MHRPFCKYSNLGFFIFHLQALFLIIFFYNYFDSQTPTPKDFSKLDLDTE